MKTTKRIIMSVAAMAVTGIMNAQLSVEVADSVPTNGRYNPELGYFQKAYSDIGDPRFMITDKDGTFTLGIGGTIRASTYYDFDGTLSSKSSKFNVYKITAPSDFAKHFGLDAVNSELHAKAKTKIGKHTIIAFLKVSANDDEFIKLSNAYVSFDGFTIGRVYSFFMDLEAGPRTVDMAGPCSQISATQPLIGFTLPIDKKWTVAASVENPVVKTFNYPNIGMLEDYQNCPDIVLKGKYKWNNGHVQLAGLFRNCAWWRTDKHGVPESFQGETDHANGYGVALSGSYRPVKKLELSAQGYYGTGISKYVNDLGDLKCDLIPLAETNDHGLGLTGLVKEMKAVPVTGGYLSIGYHWTDRLSSFLVGGFSKLDISKDESKFTYEQMKSETDPTKRGVTLKKAFYTAANIFYNINDYCTVGIEANYGNITKYNFNKISEQGMDDRVEYKGEVSGHATRINGTFIYQF